MSNNTILVPIDFSKCSKQALKYAINVAKTSKRKLVLVHSFYNRPTPLKVINANRNASLEEKAHSALKEMVNHVKNLHRVSCDYITGTDPIPQLLERCIKIKKAGLVIMGTKGAGGINEFIWGSWASEVVRTAKRPVMVVPESLTISEISKMAFASDLHESDLTAIKQMIDLAKIFHAHVEILHISRGTKISDEESKRMEEFMEMVERNTDYLDMTYRILCGKKIGKALDEYIVSHKISLIGLSTRHRNWIERVLESSMSRKMVMHTHIPLIVFHYEQSSVLLI